MIQHAPVTPEDTLEIETLEKAYEHQQYLKSLLLQYTSRNVELPPLDLHNGIATIPFPSLINIIEQNITILFGVWEPSTRKYSIEWLGELLDLRPLDYTDVNRWFEMLQLLEQLIIAIPKRVPITGTFRTGNNRTRQVIKRTYIWNYRLDGSWELGEKPFVEFR